MANSSEKLRNILSSEVKFIIGIVVFVLGGVAPYYSIKQDIALIQKDIEIINSNHLSHVQDLTQEIKDIKKEQLEMQKQILIKLNQ